MREREDNPFYNANKQAVKNPQRVIHFFPETSLMNGHRGLSLIAKEEADVDTADLAPGQFLVFMNRSRTQLKMYAPGNVIAHFKLPEGKGRINPLTIKYLPRVFNGREINYTAALEMAIKEALGK